ncbi:MAG: glycosyltransferase [Tissierellales bacterium]|nr:glycosyltransferase [Tissierellales bacterium]
MKILVLFGPDIFGGSFVVAEQVACRYVAAGHEVLMIVKDPYSVRRYQEQGFKVVSISSMKRRIDFINDIKSAYQLSQLCKKYGCGVIHSHTSKGGFYSRMSKFFNRDVKVIHTVHGYYQSSSSVKTFVFDIIERLLLPLGDVTTFVNREDYERTLPYGNALKYIPNGVDLEYFTTNRDFKARTFNVIISARMVWEKGYREIVELVKRFEGEDILFHIVGTGENEEEIRGLLVGYSSVVFYGFVSDIRGVLDRVHLNLLPSYREGLSLSILEAMASGIPTVAYEIRGNRELVESGSTGFLCSLHDVEALEHRVRFYYDHRDICQDHGKKARAKAEKEYNAEVNYKTYLEILEAISHEA